MENRENFRKPRRTARALVAATALSLGACEGQNDTKESLALEVLAQYKLGNGTVSILKEAGLTLDGTSLSPMKVEEGINKAVAFAESAKALSVRIGQGAENIDVGVQLSFAEAPLHGFVVVKDEANVAAFVGQPIAAATEINVENNNRVTYLVPLPQGAGRFRFNSGALDPNGYSLAVESCNNLLNIHLDQTSNRYIENQFPTQKQEGAKLVFQKLTTEAVCNSYALASATKQANIPYEEYQNVAGQAQLGQNAGLGFRVPYIVFPRNLWLGL